jgi:DNA adenine methylase
MLTKLISLAPQKYKRYIEPFCGSACLFLALQPRRAVLADINPHIINTYQALKTDPKAIYDLLQGWEPTKEQYLSLRANQNSHVPAFAAARFIFLNRYCFNGVYRENLRGEFNVPFGGYRSGRLPQLEELQKFAATLDNVDLICGDFSAAITAAKREDFIYLDPPYFYGNIRNRGQYGWNAFSDEDLERLAANVIAASNRGVKILISYNKAHKLKAHLAHWTLTYCTVKRSVAGFANSRSTVREFQLRNYDD